MEDGTNGSCQSGVIYALLAECMHCALFASHFVVKGRKANCKRLQGCYRVQVVHAERVLADLHRVSTSGTVMNSHHVQHSSVQNLDQVKALTPGGIRDPD